jgi:hypothetical protein
MPGAVVPVCVTFMPKNNLKVSSVSGKVINGEENVFSVAFLKSKTRFLALIRSNS